MPKPLTTTPPPSAVARLLDVGTAQRATAAVLVQPTTSEPATTGEPAHVKREVVLTRSTDETLNRLVETFRRRTGAKLSASHVVRAVLTMLASCAEEIDTEASRIGLLRLPSNAKGNEAERERFEEALRQAIESALRLK